MTATVATFMFSYTTGYEYGLKYSYRQTSNISRTLVNIIVDSSDVVGA